MWERTEIFLALRLEAGIWDQWQDWPEEEKSDVWKNEIRASTELSPLMMW